MNGYLFTSESVTEGHPDKICDQISDAILDEVIKNDPYSRVACETCITTGLVLIMGEISTDANVDFAQIARDTLMKIGFTKAEYGIDANTCGIIVSIDKQSDDIALGVDKSFETKNKKAPQLLGAGDQGMMFGYATDETPEFLPYPISLAHKLAFQLAKIRKDNIVRFLRPDGKTQVTIEYDENDKPLRIDTIVISAQHNPDTDQTQLASVIKKYVIDAIIDEKMIDVNTKIYINPTGRFVIGGPQGDSGLTGRKIIVDTYGGAARHGGGAFSGKDCTKVDRTAAYAARYIAKNVVAANFAKKCEIQLSYAIGVSEPVSLMIDCFGTNKYPEERIREIIMDIFDLTPNGIINRFSLRNPIYKSTSVYGHFGRQDQDFPWERLDMVQSLKSSINI